MELKGSIVHLKTYQRVCRKEHFMGKFQGFGISQSILDNLENQEVKAIRFVYIGANGEQTLYYTSIKAFQQSTKTHTFGKDDLQKFVSLSDMVEIK